MKNKIILVGDSTIDHENFGWGAKLDLFIKEEIVNKAKSGRSSKSYIDEGRWDEVLSEIAPGNYVFIQFGHNDQKLEDPARGTQPFGDYQKNLKMFVESVREKGAKPVLVTPVQRRTFNEQGEVENSLGAYPKAMKEVALELNAPLIDLWMKSKELYESLGAEQSKSLFSWYDVKNQAGEPDDTHFNLFGANQIAKLVGEEFELLFLRKSSQ